MKASFESWMDKVDAAVAAELLMSEFETVSTAHEDCVECAMCVVDASIMAKVTGSTGATYQNSPGDHKAVVRRVARPATTGGLAS